MHSTPVSPGSPGAARSRTRKGDSPLVPLDMRNLNLGRNDRNEASPSLALRHPSSPAPDPMAATPASPGRDSPRPGQPGVVRFEIPIWSSFKTLPGTNLNLESGFQLAQSGVVFANKADGSVIYGGQTPELQELYLKLEKERPKEDGRKGSFNSFVAMPKTAAQKAAALLGFAEDLQMGARRQLRGTPYLKKKLWHELWMTLHAAAEDIAPPVLSGIITGDGRLSMFLERGESLRKYLERNENQNAALKMGASLVEILDKASEMRLIMSDIKPDNIVVLSESKMRFIDFDPVYTAFVDARPECIMLINTMLFLNMVSCHNVTPTYQSFTVFACAKLRQLTRDLEAGKGEDELCNVLSQLAGKDAESFTEVETMFQYVKAAYGGSDDKARRAIAAQVIFMAGHYAGWVDDGKPYACARRFDKTTPALSQIARQITAALAPSFVPTF